jgi:hypothetical protein
MGGDKKNQKGENLKIENGKGFNLGSKRVSDNDISGQDVNYKKRKRINESSD